MKGYIEYDQDSLAFALFGATTTLAVGERVMPKTSKKIKAGVGALLGLGLRAALDPSMAAERAKK